MTAEKERHIIHVDMNAFYCACHAAAEPERYRGRATAVAGSPETRHGVVVTASYEARTRGVRATMTVPEALKACPELILIHPDFELYRSYSARVFDLIREFTPLVEIFSIDECWADVSGSRQFGGPIDIAKQIQSRLLHDIGIPCSIGVGPNKFLAKMGSDFHKPLGITELSLPLVPSLLWPLPVGHMFGVGKKGAERLERVGIRTIGDLAQTDTNRLLRMFGKRAYDLHNHANGVDTSPVSSEREPLKSVGHSITLSQDVADEEELKTVLLNLCDQVGRRVRHHLCVGRTIQLTIRYANRETVTRSKTLPRPTNLTEILFDTSCSLLMEHRRPGQKVRLLGVSIAGLDNAADDFIPSPASKTMEQQLQLPLFEEESHPSPIAVRTSAPGAERDTDRLNKLTAVSDKLRDKYGEEILIRGRMLQQHQSGEIRNRKVRGTSLQKDILK